MHFLLFGCWLVFCSFVFVSFCFVNTRALSCILVGGKRAAESNVKGKGCQERRTLARRVLSDVQRQAQKFHGGFCI